MNQKKIVVDLDGTLTIDLPEYEYSEKPVNLPLLVQLRNYKTKGYSITIFTARNMSTYAGDLDLIRQYTLPVIEAWLDRHSVPYDEIIIGKPWCGLGGFYVDDKAIRPNEFTQLSHSGIAALIDEKNRADS